MWERVPREMDPLPAQARDGMEGGLAWFGEDPTAQARDLKVRGALLRGHGWHSDLPGAAGVSPLPWGRLPRVRWGGRPSGRRQPPPGAS